MEAQPCVYILASRRNGTLYTGVTRYPVQRVWQHKEGLVPGFTKRYTVRMLVYIELHDTYARGHQTRETDQGMEAGLESRIDR
jgi:putative endonuclease